MENYFGYGDPRNGPFYAEWRALVDSLPDPLPDPFHAWFNIISAGKYVDLDGEFTPTQLRLIADAADKAAALIEKYKAMKPA